MATASHPATSRGPRRRKTPRARTAGKIVGHGAAEASHPPVPEVAGEGQADLPRIPERPGAARGERLVLPFHQRAELVGRRPGPAVAERHPRAVGARVFREEVREGLALAALVVHLAGERDVDREQPDHDGGQRDAAPDRLPEGLPPVAAPAQERLDPQRQGQEQVVRLRVGRDAQDHGREERPASTPREQARRHDAEREHLGRGPQDVDGAHRREEERESAREGGARGRAPAQLRVGHDQREAQRERVDDQEPARAEEPHERRRGQRVRERLREVDPRLVLRHAVDPREARRPVPRQPPARPLQEDPLGPGGELAADAEEVAGLVAEVAVLGQAPGHRVVGRPVPPELRQPDAPGADEQRGHHERQHAARGALAHSHPARR